MPNFTAHYGLIKPKESEYYNIADFNRNADAIDTALHDGVSALAGKMPTDATPPLRNAVTGDGTFFGRWYKVASISIPAANRNATISMHVSRISMSEPYHLNGILRADIRTGSSHACSITWEYMNGLDHNDFVLAYNNTLPAVAEVWARNSMSFSHYRFDVIAEGDRDGNTAPIWTLHNRAAQELNITPGYTQKVSVPPPHPIAVGTYVGNGVVNRHIDVGFHPKAVAVTRMTGGPHTDTHTSFAVTGSGAYGDTLCVVDGGFILGATAGNMNGWDYNYMAFR